MQIHTNTRSLNFWTPSAAVVGGAARHAHASRARIISLPHSFIHPFAGAAGSDNTKRNVQQFDATRRDATPAPATRRNRPKVSPTVSANRRQTANPMQRLECARRARICVRSSICARSFIHSFDLRQVKKKRNRNSRTTAAATAASLG